MYNATVCEKAVDSRYGHIASAYFEIVRVRGGIDKSWDHFSRDANSKGLDGNAGKRKVKHAQCLHTLLVLCERQVL